MRGYLEWATRLASADGRSRGATLLRLVYARLRHDIGPAEFDAFDLIGRPVRTFGRYVPEAERERLLERVAPERWRHLEEDKVAFVHRCVRAGIAACPVLAVIGEADRETTAALSVPVARVADQVDAMLRGLGSVDGVLKRCRGGQGYGVYAIHVTAGALSPTPEYRDGTELYEWLRTLRYDEFSWVVQPRLTPHRALSGLMPGPGLGTVRLVTFLDTAGDVHVLWGLLKVPGPGAIADNWRKGTGGGLLIPVDPATGVLGPATSRRTPDAALQQTDAHPVSSVPIRGVTLPLWPDVRDLVVRGARAFPELPALGWDVAITDDGPIAIEANWNFGLGVTQAVHGGGLRAELLRRLAALAEPRAWDGLAERHTGSR